MVGENKGFPVSAALLTPIYSRLGRVATWLDSGGGRLLVLVIGVSAGAAGLLRLWRFFPWAQWPKGGDFDLYLKAANAMTKGANPYDLALFHDDPYAYPPLTAEFVAVLAKLVGQSNLICVWTALCLSAVAGAVFLIMRKFGARVSLLWLIFALGFVLFSHVVQTELFHGQVNSFIIALLLLGLMFRGEGRVWAAALCWGLMMNFKPFMGIVVFLPLWRGELKLTTTSLVVGAAIFAASFGILADPRDAFWGWTSVCRYYTGFEFAVHPNHQSFLSLFYRLFDENHYSQPWFVAPWLPRLLLIPVAALLAWAVARSIPWRGSVGQRGKAGAREMLEVSLILGAWMCVSPTTEGDHVLFLIPGLAGAFMMAAKRVTTGAQSSNLWLAALCFWVLTLLVQALPFRAPIAFVEESTWVVLHGPGILLSGYCGFTMLGAVIFSAMALRVDRQSDGHSLKA